ncbi:hypothetical protein H310_02440 [Aphanomyces invadans]|uniref:Uncharacterized protein n=1 Tax=Aphanomyces invadans TaxID=157072 RepID=A0A024UNP7_9STRA|nr:hypothetical protein H310_02440 [Aphanomyces invadans]ETW08076.1 hypothetical protein H310_02440 [Aphanomyces invadans]|eukprot:XP_008864169.1 hypothetical protein H310_02440 [Aphanomyces invadans]
MNALGCYADGVLVAATKQAIIWILDASCVCQDGLPVILAAIRYARSVPCIGGWARLRWAAPCGFAGLHDDGDEEERLPPVRDAITVIVRLGCAAEREEAVWEVLAAKLLRRLLKENTDMFRLELSTDPPINAEHQEPMLNLDAALAMLAGTSVYFNLNWMKSQEIFLFMTITGNYNPTSVIIGCTDVVVFYPAAINQMFASLLFHGVLGC